MAELSYLFPCPGERQSIYLVVECSDMGYVGVNDSFIWGKEKEKERRCVNTTGMD